MNFVLILGFDRQDESGRLIFSKMININRLRDPFTDVKIDPLTKTFVPSSYKAHFLTDASSQISDAFFLPNSSLSSIL